MGFRLIITEGVELFNHVFQLLNEIQVEVEPFLQFIEGSGKLFQQEQERHIVHCMLNLKVPEHCSLGETWKASNMTSPADWEMGNGN
jgi:hypothetical protein